MTRSWILVLAFLAGSIEAEAQQPQWQPAGPRPTTRGQVEGIKDFEVVGAIQALAPHPADANTLFAGAVNGGVWMTADAMSAAPSWTLLLDAADAISVGSMDLDPTDASHKTLVVGMGRYSSYHRFGGELSGLQRTTDGGKTWTAIDGGGVLRGKNIAGTLARGKTLVVATPEQGVLRSTDAGATWTAVSGNGLPTGPSYDLAGHNAHPDLVFTNAGNGVYRSSDAGQTWTKVSNPQMEGMMAFRLDNVKITLGAEDAVFVAIVVDGRLHGLFHSRDRGQAWSALDLPVTAEGGGHKFGIHPGGQGELHFSIAADPSNPDMVYIGGDRQPAFNEGGADTRYFPNSLGARDYTGRLFRVDASKPQGSQATPLTHSQTKSNSAPHADSRRLRFAANGMLIEADDGGVYRRTEPQSASGDWYSMNGDLQTGEFHSAAWDSNTRTLVAGAQDTGTPQQVQAMDKRWDSVSTGDGGVVAVDDTTASGVSVRYSSYFNLYGFRRETYDKAGQFQTRKDIEPVLIGAASIFVPQFYTPLRLNAVAPTRLILGGSNAVYESFDQGDSIAEIGPGIRANTAGAIAYGATGNPDLLYVGSGRRLYARRGPPPASLSLVPTYSGSADIVGIALDPRSPQRAFVIDSSKVYFTSDGGKTWTEVGADLRNHRPGTLLALAYSTSPGFPGIFVATDRGRVFRSTGPAFQKWSRFDTGLPKAPVMSLGFNRKDMVLIAATLGRGAWLLNLK